MGAQKRLVPPWDSKRSIHTIITDDYSSDNWDMDTAKLFMFLLKVHGSKSYILEIWLFLRWVYFHKSFCFSCFSVKFFLKIPAYLNHPKGKQGMGFLSVHGQSLHQDKGRGSGQNWSRLQNPRRHSKKKKKSWGLQLPPHTGAVWCMALMEGLLPHPSALAGYREPTPVCVQ